MHYTGYDFTSKFADFFLKELRQTSAVVVIDIEDGYAPFAPIIDRIFSQRRSLGRI